MAKVLNYKDRKGMYFFFCPACEEEHVFAVSGNDCNFPAWEWNNDKDKPTISPSVKVEYHGTDKNTVCHSFICDGKIQYLSDCTHSMAGMTVDLKELEDG